MAQYELVNRLDYLYKDTSFPTIVVIEYTQHTQQQ